MCQNCFDPNLYKNEIALAEQIIDQTKTNTCTQPQAFQKLWTYNQFNSWQTCELSNKK